MKITSVIINPLPRPMPEGMFDPMPEVIATFENGSTKSLFTFYPDEISFRESEFAGLTEEEAQSLFKKRTQPTSDHESRSPRRIKQPATDLRPWRARLF
jgi:hypothetical protein